MSDSNNSITVSSENATQTIVGDPSSSSGEAVLSIATVVQEPIPVETHTRENFVNEVLQAVRKLFPYQGTVENIFKHFLNQFSINSWQDFAHQDWEKVISSRCFGSGTLPLLKRVLDDRDIKMANESSLIWLSNNNVRYLKTEHFLKTGQSLPESVIREIYNLGKRRQSNLFTNKKNASNNKTPAKPAVTCLPLQTKQSDTENNNTINAVEQELIMFAITKGMSVRMVDDSFIIKR